MEVFIFEHLIKGSFQGDLNDPFTLKPLSFDDRKDSYFLDFKD